MPKPSTPSVWASGKTFGFQPSSAQQAQGFDYIATVRPGTGAPITDDHDWPLNNITTSLKWVMDQLPDGGIQALLTALLPKRSFAGSDFIRIPDTPGGLIIQWGTFNINVPTAGVLATTTVTLGTSNPTSLMKVMITPNNSDGAGVSYSVNAGKPNPNQFIAQVVLQATGMRTLEYVAIGY